MKKKNQMREIPFYDKEHRTGRCDQMVRGRDGRSGQVNPRSMAFSTGGIRHQKMR